MQVTNGYLTELWVCLNGYHIENWWIFILILLPAYILDLQFVRAAVHFFAGKSSFERF